jgi:acetyl esterase/lipase
VRELAETKPALWRGVILCNASTGPDFSKSPDYQRRPRVYIDAGSDEHAEDRLKQYQESALAHGGLVEFYIYPGENHQIVSIAAKLERTRHMVHFIFEE